MRIFDFKADYCDSAFTDPLGIEVIDLRDRGLPFNPLQPPPRGASGIQPAEHAYELAGVLARVFKLGAVQQGHLRDAINGAYEAAGIPPREWVDPAKANWPFFDQVVAQLAREWWQRSVGDIYFQTLLRPNCSRALSTNASRSSYRTCPTTKSRLLWLRSSSFSFMDMRSAVTSHGA